MEIAIALLRAFFIAPTGGPSTVHRWKEEHHSRSAALRNEFPRTHMFPFPGLRNNQSKWHRCAEDGKESPKTARTTDTVSGS